MIEIKNTTIKIKNAFDGLISRLETAEERMSEHEDMMKETPKTEKEKEKRKKTGKTKNLELNIQEL